MIIGKILTQININELILSILLINLIKLLAKTIAYKRSLNSNISKTVCPIWQKFGN